MAFLFNQNYSPLHYLVIDVPPPMEINYRLSAAENILSHYNRWNPVSESDRALFLM